MEGLLALPFVGAIVAPALSVFFYLYSRRRRDVAHEHDTYRSYLFYRMASGVLLAQFVGHTYLGGADERFMFIFVAIGYVSVMDWGDNVGREWNTNADYSGPVNYDYSDDEHSDIGLDRTTMQQQPMIVTQDVGSEAHAQEMRPVMDAAKRNKKRRWLLGVLLCVLAIICIMDGFLMVMRWAATTATAQRAGLIVCYYANGAALSVAVYSAMIHAKLHAPTKQDHRPRAWIAITVLWCAILMVSAAIALGYGQDPLTMAAALQHRAFLAFYGLASGCVLWLHRYYYNMKRGQMDRSRTAWGMVVFAAALYQGVATAWYL